MNPGECLTTEIKRLVLDVLKPHQPTVIELAGRLSALHGVVGVNCTIEEVDRETETLKITIEGNALEFEKVDQTIREVGAVIHSVDSVSAGKRIVDDVRTPQDHH